MRKTPTKTWFQPLGLACAILVLSLSSSAGFQAFICLVEPAESQSQLAIRTPPIDSAAARPSTAHFPAPNKTPRRQITLATCASEVWRDIPTATRQRSGALVAALYHSRINLSGPLDRAPPSLPA